MTKAPAGDLVVEYVPADTVQPHPANARRGRPEEIARSVETNGVYKPIVVQRSTGYVLAGNHTLKALQQLGHERVPVVYRDVDDTAARRIMLADNRTADLGTYDLDDLVANLKALPDLDGTGYDDEDLTRLLDGAADEYLGGPTGPDRDPDDSDGTGDGDQAGPLDPDDAGRYTAAVNIPQYQPVGPPPPVSELYDTTKADELAEEVRQVDGLDPDLRAFLLEATRRHTVVNYRKVAELYPHLPAEAQALVEASALVIIDLDDAIAGGFVRLTERIRALREAEAGPDVDPETEDAA